jgi:vacuolar-type H+-ATPase subunit H
VVDDKVLEEIQFHQDVIKRDAASPLYQIREKEIEISGRVLAAKKQAETIVGDARRKSAETVNKAEGEGDQLVKDFEKKTLADSEAEAAKIRSGIGDEVAELDKAITARKPEAVQMIVKTVTEV